MPAPTFTDAKVYLGDSAPADADISNALAAEKAAQANACKVPADTDAWPADLAEALKRRVARNLFMKGLPSGAESSATEFGSTTVRVGSDPEVKRLEGPYRKRVVG